MDNFWVFNRNSEDSMSKGLNEVKKLFKHGTEPDPNYDPESGFATESGLENVLVPKPEHVKSEQNFDEIISTAARAGDEIFTEQTESGKEHVIVSDKDVVDDKPEFIVATNLDDLRKTRDQKSFDFLSFSDQELNLASDLGQYHKSFSP